MNINIMIHLKHQMIMNWFHWWKSTMPQLEEIPVRAMPQLEQYEKVEVTAIKILTPNKLLTKLSIPLAQIKALNNSFKLKDEIRQILYLLYQHNQYLVITM